ncbi:MAG: SDR family oxidoreductase [Phycisphaerales bacterium JB039]
MLDGRVAIVTGASAGIGEAIARDLGAGGARIVLNARREDRLRALADQIGADRTAVVAGDAADPEVIAAMLDAAPAHFGAEADLVVANAGRGLRGGLLESDPADWEEIFRINALGAARLLRAAVERMGRLDDTHGRPGEAPQRARDIVVLGSTVGRNLSPFSAFYGSAKAAAHMLAESARRAAGPRGVRVTLIEPGVVASEFQQVAGYDPQSFGEFMERIGPVLTPEDIARTVRFIVSQAPNVHLSEVMIRPTRQEYP